MQQHGWSKDCHTEWRKSDREGGILYDIPYIWNLKINDTNEFTKQKEIHRLWEWTYGCQREGWGQGIGHLGKTCTHCYI